MAMERIPAVSTTHEHVWGDQFFGEYELLPPDQPLNLAPIKRVAILTEAFLPKVDGVSKTAFLTLRYLQQTGREALVFAPDIAPKAIGDSRVIPLPSLTIPAAPETHMALPHPIIAKELSAFQPDLIQLFSPAAMSVSGMVMGRYLKVPVIANYQTDLPGYMRQYGYSMLAWPMHLWLRHIHNGCHLTLVPSKTTEQELKSWGYRRLRPWVRGVNTKRFTPLNYDPAMRQRLLNGRDPQALLVIYVGRLANEKRVDVLIDIARTPGIALTIIGHGARRADLEALFSGTGTHFTGYLYGEELAKAFASADVFAFPGPNETFGQVIQEAMASGLPIIVGDEGAAKDLVTEGENGFICPLQPQAFAQAAQILRDQPHLLKRMSRKARQFAESRPWWRIMAQLEDYYREAIALNQRFNRIYGQR